MGQMTDIEIPTRIDLMYPTLVAVRSLGGSARRSEMVEKVPEIAGVSDEQLAVVFSGRLPSIRENPRFSTESGGLVRT